MPAVDQILLQTKLHRPRLPKDLVTRWRLVEWLNQDIDRQMILVCSPAGFGKTTLVSSWLKQMAADPAKAAAALPAAWLSLDENDSDLNLFLRYFIAALRTIFGQACEETLALLLARQPAPQAVLSTTFINELEKLPGEAVLVLDDYQAIRGAEVHKLLGELMHHWPRPLHLVLISRLSPPLPLSSLRAKGMISEIRTRDLRFTPEETATYLSQSRFAQLSLNALPLLEERFEGWPAGLKLASLSMRSEASRETVISALSRENANITEYLVDEVLTHQFPAIHTFLLKTSILDRFSASLCEAVIGEIDPGWNAGACLEWIERSELFLIPLDDRREWYRYHHLFQESLQQRLSAEMIPEHVNEMHLRASVWFEEHGLIDEALHHALAAGNIDLASSQIGAGLRDALNREDRPTLERWLRLLPEDMIQRNPDLLMVRAWILEWTWRLDQQAQVLEQVEKLLDSEASVSLPAEDLQILRGQILTFKAQQAYFGNRTTLAIDLCRQSLALLPSSWTFARGGAMFFLGLSMQASGQALEAERLLLAEYGSYDDKTNPYIMLLLRSLGFIYLNTGQLEQVSRIAQVQLERSIHNKITIMKNWADWFLGVVHYQRYELQAAAQYFTQIVENRFTAQISIYRDAVAGLALIHQIQGERAEAWQMLESLSQFDLEQSGSEDNRTRALRARLLLLQGDLEGAGNWADTFPDLPPDVTSIWLEEPQVIRTRALIARGAEADLHSALRILATLDEITERTHNTRYKIEILALRALALNAVAQRAAGEISAASAAALSVLEQALDLARLGGFIRVFVDLGQPMQTMLRQLAGHNHPAEMVQRILAAFPKEDVKPVGSESPAGLSRHPASGNATLLEPLTPRELEVLSLLTGPVSIKEIAQQLHISYPTAKRHTINIYGKLGVHRRWDAVAKAEELNILPLH